MLQLSASLPQLLERNSIAEMMNNNLSDKYNSSSTTLCSSVHAGKYFVENLKVDNDSERAKTRQMPLNFSERKKLDTLQK